MRGPSRRQPFPFDMLIGGTGVMLAVPKERGAYPLVATKTSTMDEVAPSSYDYSATSPLARRTQPFDDLSLGFGLKVQVKFTDRRYAYALGADCSIGGLWLKGPSITSVVPATTDAAVLFFELGGSLYLLTGRYCLKRDSDSAWSVSKDFGAGKAAVDAVTFYSNGPTATGQFAYVAMGDSEPLYRFDGTTWTQHVERQTVTISGTPTGGTYTLTYNGNTTAALAYNADATAVSTALRALAGLATVTVTSTGTSPNYTHTVTFTGVTGDATLLAATSSLTGGTSPAVAVAVWEEVLYARAFAVTGNDLYRASGTNTLSKVDTDADPFDERNWNAVNAFVVGDKSSGITRLAVSATGTLLVCKTDGLYTLDEAGEDHRLFPFLAFETSSENGKWVGQFGNDLYTTYGKTHYRVDAEFGIEAIGPERFVENDSPVKGRVTATAAVGGLHMLAGLYDDDTGSSHLLKFGAYLTSETPEGDRPEVRRIDAWHGSISHTYTNKKITALVVSSVGAPSGHTRTYLAFSDGSLGYFTNPCVPNPAACDQYGFTTTTAEIHLPYWHGLFRSDSKTLRALVLAQLAPSTTEYATVDYKLDQNAASWTALGTTFDQAPTERAEFPNNTATYLAALRVNLHSSVTTAAPQVTGIGLEHAVRPALVLLYDFLVLAADGLVKRDGTPMRLGAVELADLVKAAAEAAGSVTFVLPDESSQQLSVVDYQERIAWAERLRAWRKALGVKAVQFKTNTIYGTWDRAEAYTWDQLESFTWDQMESL